MEIAPGAHHFSRLLTIERQRTVADICCMVGLTSVGSFTTSFRRMFGKTPTAYRAAHPPASNLARIPACVVRAYARPEHRTFREDAKPDALVR